MLELIDGQVRFHNAPFDHRLALSWRLENAWRPLPLKQAGGQLLGEDGPVLLQLSLEQSGEAIAYQVAFTSALPTRIQLALLLPDAREPFHLIPSFLFGDNNLGSLPPGQAPNLTLQHPDNVSCSPYWECRADRASHPVSLTLWQGGLAALSIDPYSDGRPLAGNPHDAQFIRNGLFVQLAHEGRPAACGATLGYGNLPRTFFSVAQFTPTTAHFSRSAHAAGSIFLRPASERTAAHGVVRAVYQQHREQPQPPISRRQAANDLVTAFIEVNWHGDNAANADGSSSGSSTPFFGGKPFRNNFTNMRCSDEQKQRLQAWRTLAEVGWSGGGVIGYPLLAAGVQLGHDLARQRGLYKLDCVADAFNPASGLLWDVSGVTEGKRLNWWWSAPPYMDCHCAYTNGSACYYLLKASRLAAGVPGLADSARAWQATALRVLDTVTKLQLPDGNLGWTYRSDRPEILLADGFAGAWFLPGLAYAYHFTGQQKFLDAAVRAMSFYHRDVKQLRCCGTPMDVHNLVDQEGNLGFFRGAMLLHEFTGSSDFLPIALDSAHYEYLWRYGFRSRPQYPPLRDSPFNSCGGSITSSGTSMHPMGVSLATELAALARLSGDNYHQQRGSDGLDWAANCVALYPEHSGYGRRGVMTERFSPSDGTALESYPDGTPSSMWFSYNGWAAAAMLEGLTEDLAR